jgi:hypothetical protein
LSAGVLQLFASQALSVSEGARIGPKERTRLVTAVLIPQNQVEMEMQKRFLRVADVRFSEESDAYDFREVARQIAGPDVRGFFNFLEAHPEWVRRIHQKSGCCYAAAICLFQLYVSCLSNERIRDKAISAFEFGVDAGLDAEDAMFEARAIAWKGEYLDRWGLCEAASLFLASSRDQASIEAFANALRRQTVQVDLLRVGSPLAVIRSSPRLYYNNVFLKQGGLLEDALQVLFRGGAMPHAADVSSWDLAQIRRAGPALLRLEVPGNLRYGDNLTIYNGSGTGMWPDQTNVSLLYTDFQGTPVWLPRVGTRGHVVVIVGGFERDGEKHFILQNAWKERELIVITARVLKNLEPVWYVFDEDYADAVGPPPGGAQSSDSFLQFTDEGDCELPYEWLD